MVSASAVRNPRSNLVNTGSTRPFEDLKSFVLRLVELLRPSFYSRITWLIVISGIAMMSTGIVKKIVSGLLERQFNISISGSNDAAWGFSLCVLGLVYHLANTGLYELLKSNETRDRRKLECTHDRLIFQKANELLSEEQLVNFIDQLEDDHSYYMDQSGAVDRFARFLAGSSNSFLSSALRKSAESFCLAWGGLGQFISYKFYIYPEGQSESPLRLCMAPNLNVDRAGMGTLDQVERYDELTTQLYCLTQNVTSEYRALRATVKAELFI